MRSRRAFDRRGEMPRVDQLPVDRGLLAHRFETGAVEKGLASGWLANACRAGRWRTRRRRAQPPGPSGRPVPCGAAGPAVAFP